MNVVYRKQFPKRIKECLDSCPKPGLKCLCKQGLGIGELVKTGRGESLGEQGEAEVVKEQEGGEGMGGPRAHKNGQLE